MIIVFIGPPLSGKDTQTGILGKELNLPVFSMGALIREGVKNGDPKAIEGYENYSLKGLHLPNSLKFHLLKTKLDQHKDGFILDNYPATEEDLEMLNNYLLQNDLEIDKAFLIKISVEEMKNRLGARNRQDDDPKIAMERREVQDMDREPVLEFFKEKGLLIEINGEGSIDGVHKRITERLYR
jgi:adenylate kinase